MEDFSSRLTNSMYAADKLTAFRYWFGVPDKNGRNLATCVWRSSRDAKIGSVGPHHRVAANAARHMYTEWKSELNPITGVHLANADKVL